MKKILSMVFMLLVLCGCDNQNLNTDKTVKKDPPKKIVIPKNQKQVNDEIKTENNKITDTKLDILTLFSSNSTKANKLWVGTFQLVFNDMKNNIIKNDIKFINEEETDELKGLNSEEFTKDMIQESSYYTSYGETSPEAKEQIKKDIKKKFNETSDILDNIDWTKQLGKYYAYAIIKKEFHFLHIFDDLGEYPFNNSEKNYQYFGISDLSDPVLDSDVKVLFYNDYNDYAIRLLTKENDIVYLYRTESNESFKNIYDEMISKQKNYKGRRFLGSKDTIKVPLLKIKEQRNYTELCNKQIEGTEIMFDNAIEIIELELNEKGGKVKSEAALTTRLTALAPIEDAPKHFNFDHTFVLFLIDNNKTDPYLALRVQSLEGLQ